MNYEEQIMELKKRIEVLEKAEHKRIVKKRNEIIFRVVKSLVIVIALVWGSLYVYNNLIKPYKKKIDRYEETIEKVEAFIDDKWGAIQNWNPFS